jgi:beta-glucosidase
MLTLLVGAGRSAGRWGATVRAVGIALGVIALCPTIAAAASGACGDPTSRPWCRADLSPDQRATLLLRALTQTERISLLEGDDLVGVAGGANNHTRTSNGIDRLGVPTVHFTDGTAGIRQGTATAMPVSIAVAATFDPALARLGGQLLGVEARDKGNVVCACKQSSSAKPGGPEVLTLEDRPISAPRRARRLTR